MSIIRMTVGETITIASVRYAGDDSNNAPTRPGVARVTYFGYDAVSGATTFKSEVTKAFGAGAFMSITGGIGCGETKVGQSFVISGGVGAVSTFAVSPPSSPPCALGQVPTAWFYLGFGDYVTDTLPENNVYVAMAARPATSIDLASCVPDPDSIHVYLNGVEQFAPNDWTLMPPDADHTSWWIRPEPAMEALSGDLLEARYACQSGQP